MAYVVGFPELASLMLPVGMRRNAIRLGLSKSKIFMTQLSREYNYCFLR